MSSARLAVVTRNQTSGNTPTARTVDEGKAGDRISGEGYGDEKPAPPTTVPMSSPVAEPVGVTSSSGAAGAKPAQRSSAAKCGRRLRRTRRAIKSGWRRLFDILYWVIDTLRVWDISAGSGISSSGRPKASCKERLFRWVFALGAACWASLLFVWNSTYFNPSYPVQFGKLGIACGVLAGLIRPICFHNRWLCYRRVPRRDGRTRLVNVSSNKQGMADVVAGAMGQCF